MELMVPLVQSSIDGAPILARVGVDMLLKSLLTQNFVLVKVVVDVKTNKSQLLWLIVIKFSFESSQSPK